MNNKVFLEEAIKGIFESKQDGVFEDRKKLMEFVYKNIDMLKTKKQVDSLIQYMKELIADVIDGEKEPK